MSRADESPPAETEPTRPAPRGARAFVVPAVKLTVAAAILTFLVRSGRIDLDHLATIESVPAVLLGILAILAGFVASTLRWHGLLRGLGIAVPRRTCFRISWLGLLGSQVLPGVTGGDLVRGASIARAVPSGRLPAVFSVVIDRGIGLVGLLLIGTVALLTAPEALRADPLLATVTRTIAFLCLGGISGLLLLASPRVWRLRPLLVLGERFDRASAPGRLFAALRLLEGRHRMIAVALLWSILAHAMTVTAAFVIARANLGGDAGFVDYALLVPVGQLAAALPISPGGMGVSEWVYEGMFARLGAHHGAELSLWLRVLNIIVSLGALPWLVAHRAPAGTGRRAAARSV